MGRRPKPEEIVSKLRQVDVSVSQGKTVADSVRSIGVTDVTYYRWRKDYGGLKLDQRGGSGNLNRWAEWSFCLTAARMVAEQERR